MESQGRESPSLALPDPAEINQNSPSIQAESSTPGDVLVSTSQQSASLTSLDLDTKLALANATQSPPRSQKHEAAIQDLKSFITTVLSSKLDEIKNSVANKIQGGSAGGDKDAKAKVKK